jgi:DNA-directed RNA polymerase subunit RPC12/RpoP
MGLTCPYCGSKDTIKRAGERQSLERSRDICVKAVEEDLFSQMVL